MKEKWAAERTTPKVRESQSASPASCFQLHSTCLMRNPAEKPLTLNKEERGEMIDMREEEREEMESEKQPKQRIDRGKGKKSERRATEVKEAEGRKDLHTFTLL